MEKYTLLCTIYKVPISRWAIRNLRSQLFYLFLSPSFLNQHHSPPSGSGMPIWASKSLCAFSNAQQMPGDNSPDVAPDVKREEVDPLQSYCCHGSGETMPYVDTSATTEDCRSRSSPICSFNPRPFPPPSLAGVPTEYIVDQLHVLAPQYWNKPETADCTIIVPVPHGRGRPVHPLLSACFPPESRSAVATMYDLSGLGRRATEPTLNYVPRISLELHVDYLSAHSSYLRRLFSGASPLHLINTDECSTPVSPTLTSSGRFTIPTNRLPHLMPSSPDHPILLLPVPDPTSFHLLVHWMYFGDTRYIEDCLCQKTIQWEGIARNVEYLDLSTEIKIFLGRWYACWLHPGDQRTFEDDSETACSDDDDDDDSTLSDLDEDFHFDDGKEVDRGRTRMTRPLSLQGP